MYKCLLCMHRIWAEDFFKSTGISKYIYKDEVCQVYFSNNTQFMNAIEIRLL